MSDATLGTGHPVALADAGQRIGAWVLDTAFTAIVTAVLAIILHNIDSNTFSDCHWGVGEDCYGYNVVHPGMMSVFFIGPALRIIYETTMVALAGRTFGKTAVGIEVVRADDGLKPGWARSAARCFARWPMAIPLLYFTLDTYYFFGLEAPALSTLEGPLLIVLIGGLILFTTGHTSFIFAKKKRQGLHDMLARTLVIQCERKRQGRLHRALGRESRYVSFPPQGD